MTKRLDPQEGYSRFAQSYDENEKYWDSFEKNHLKPYFEASKGKRVLDAGAGTGRLTMKLFSAGADVTALDFSPDMLEKLQKKNPDIKTVEGDVENMPFDDDQFDFVFSSLTLVHLKKIIPFLDECYRILKDEGKLVLVNVHYRRPMLLEDDRGTYTIKCYNHFPRHVREAAEELAYNIDEEIIVTEGDDVWVSQILILRK